MEITVVGLGYVGLVTASCLAKWGNRVHGIEADPNRLARLSRGDVPFFEPGLSELVREVMADGRLSVAGSDDVPRAAARSDAVILAVGTHDGNGGWQTITMTRTLTEVVPWLADGSALVIRSTLPPEFIMRLPEIVEPLRLERELRTVPIALNPEFTREGRAIEDFMRPERVVVGAVSDPHGEAEAVLRRLYAPADAPVLVTSAIDAAFGKLGSNLFLATKISFANELSALCEQYGADVDAVVRVMSYDSRIGGQFLNAGLGFGGSCLPHQVSMTVVAARETGVPSPLLEAVDEVNHGQRTRFADRLLELAGGRARPKIALLGLAFKPGTDDLRDAPSLTVARLLLAAGASVVAYDPMPSARTRAAELVPGLAVADDPAQAIAGADAIGLVTEWPEFRRLDWRALRDLPRTATVLDGRKGLSAADMRSAGFEYEAFGRGRAAAERTGRSLEAVHLIDQPSGAPEAMPDLTPVANRIPA